MPLSPAKKQGQKGEILQMLRDYTTRREIDYEYEKQL